MTDNTERKALLGQYIDKLINKDFDGAKAAFSTFLHGKSKEMISPAAPVVKEKTSGDVK